MRAVKILIPWMLCGLIISGLIWYLPPKIHPQYTAQAFIRVLQAPDLTSSSAPRVQSRWIVPPRRNSVIALLQDQATLDALLDRDEIQWGGWYQSLGTTKGSRLSAGVPDLKKRLRVIALPDSDLIAVSITSGDGQDAAAIVNKIVSSFLQLQQTAKRTRISVNLAHLEEQSIRIQRDLTLAEGALDDVRRRYGFIDLEQNSYPDPVTTRLIRLQELQDNRTLEIEQVRTRIEYLEAQSQRPAGEKTSRDPNAELKELTTARASMEKRLEKLQKMLAETKQKQDDLALARVQYAQRRVIRDERRQILDKVKSMMEELKILYDDPDASGLQYVQKAAAPVLPDTVDWKTIVPVTVIAALILGIIHLLAVKKSKKPAVEDRP
jgi:hypothetical protein